MSAPVRGWAPTRGAAARSSQSGPPTRARCACGGLVGPTGECASCRRRRTPVLQPRLRVRRGRDRHEREADRNAEVFLGGGSPGGGPLGVTPLGERPDRKEGAAVAAPPGVSETLSAPGRPLDPALRRETERHFGRDLGKVRLHTDGEAARAARAVGARAFTSGWDVAFGSGEYRPGTPAGRRLLAHELTHALQQSAMGDAAPDAAPRTIQRQPLPSPDAPTRPEGPLTPARAADQAEAACDIKGLCRLRFSNPEVVTDARVARVVGRCRPGVLVSRAPCLDPTILSPELFGPPLPGDALTGPTAKGGKGESGGGLPDLGKLLTFEFSTGDVAYTVKLPSSAKARLPVEFRNAYKLTFTLEAKASGAFSFSITLDGLPHVQIKSTTTADVAGKSFKSELAISSRLKTCHAPGKQASREALTKAGEKLKTAIEQVNKSPQQVEAEKAAAKTGADVPARPPEGFDRVERLGDVVSGIVDVKKAIDDAQKGCEPAPTISFGVTGQVPFDPSAEDAAPATVTGGLTIRF